MNITNKEIKQFTKDMLKISAQQSLKIKVLEKKLKDHINNNKPKGILDEKLKNEINNLLTRNNEKCFITAFIKDTDKIPKELFDEKMQEFNNKIEVLMREYGIDDVTAKMIKHV